MSVGESSQGLGFSPLPADEYDSYLIELIRMAETGSSKQEIVLYLEKVERDYLMLTDPDGNKGDFAEAILDLQGSGR